MKRNRRMILTAAIIVAPEGRAERLGLPPYVQVQYSPDTRPRRTQVLRGGFLLLG